MERLLGPGQALTGPAARRLAAVWAGMVLLLAGTSAMACINTFNVHYQDARAKGDTKAMADIALAAEKAYRESPTLENTNDLAVTWILAGRLEPAIELLRELETRQPGNARVAANLGTALELAGNDEEALRWIRESVRRDPQEHAGSEWVHVKILEAKLTLRKNPNWLRTRSVVGWREGEQLLADERGRVRSPADLIEPISYQLRERTQFVQPPDPIIGDLYLTLGDIAHSTSAAYASPWERDDAEASAYGNALLYGTVHEVRTRERLEEVQRRIDASREERQAAAVRQARDGPAQDALLLERKVQEEQKRAAREQEQSRRRLLALGVFISLALVFTSVIFWRRRKRRSA